MNSIINYCKIAVAVLGGILGWLLGGFDSFIYALIAFVAMDYVTGVLVAIHNKKVSSEIGFKGICKKILIFILVSMGNIIDQYILGSGSALRTLLIMFYLSNEGISIIENTGKMGLPFPRKLKDVIEKLKENDDNRD
ncbi:MAG: phage holin family protein [Clostridiales bacterium]|nr:phage holin family protein [Clostridiales bacterium]